MLNVFWVRRRGCEGRLREQHEPCLEGMVRATVLEGQEKRRVLRGLDLALWMTGSISGL